MQNKTGSLILRYGCAALSIALATGIRLLLDPVLGDQFPYATFFFAVLLTAGYGGFGPALVAVVLGASSSAYFLIPPRGSFAVVGWDQQAGMILYLTTSLGIALLGGAMRAAQKRAERAKEAEQERVRQVEEEAAARKDAEESLTVALDAAQMGQWDLDLVNDTARRSLRHDQIFGYPSLLPGWGWEVFIGHVVPDDRESVTEQFKRATEKGEQFTIESRIVWPDQSIHWIAARGQVYHDDQGKPVRMAGVVMEITQRKLAEETVRAQREQLRVTLASIGDAVIAADAEGRVTFLNSVACSITGWTPEGATGMLLSEVFNIINEQTRLRVENPAVRALNEGVVVGLANHTVLIAKDGTERPIDDSAAPIRDERGTILGVVLVFRDVTERRRSEETLRQSEARKTAIFETALDCIITMNHEGTVIEFNPAAERTFGYSRAQAVGLELADLIIPPPLRERHRQGLAHYLATGEGPVLNKRLEMTALRADGTEFPVELAVTRIPGEAPPLFTAYLRDITGRRRAEQASRFLADASKSLAALVDSASTMQKVARLAVPFFADWCAVDVVEEGGSVRRLAVSHADPAKVELAHELERRYPSDPNALHGVPNVLRTGQSEMLTEIPDSLLAASAQDREHLRILRELGLKSYLCVPLVARGKVVAAITFISAESGRRYDATDLAVAEDLAHRAGIAMENARLYSEVREGDRRKDEFLAMLAHELRNPLAPIRNALHIMKQPGAKASVVEQVREMMERQVQHMTRMVDDLLDVSRITRGKIELRKEVVDLASVVSRTVEATRPLIEDRRQELTVALPPVPVRLEADPTRLEQVLANLLNNAAKYTDQGGHIWLAAEQENGELVLRVKDTGMGLPAEMLSSIFEPFVQSDRVLHRSQGGLGIGLTLVRSLVEMHGGKVQAHSDGPGRGSEFIVRLPTLLQKESGRSKRTADGSNEPVLATSPKRRIVVVDDNVDAAESLAMLLRLEGHDVRVAHDGPAALAAVDADPPDIMFLDIGMPVMNGYEVAQRLRQRPGLENLLLVAMTGWGQDEDRRRSQEAGFDHHMVKPAEPAALQQLLATRKS